MKADSIGIDRVAIDRPAKLLRIVARPAHWRARVVRQQSCYEGHRRRSPVRLTLGRQEGACGKEDRGVVGKAGSDCI